MKLPTRYRWNAVCVVCMKEKGLCLDGKLHISDSMCHIPVIRLGKQREHYLDNNSHAHAGQLDSFTHRRVPLVSSTAALCWARSAKASLMGGSVCRDDLRELTTDEPESTVGGRFGTVRIYRYAAACKCVAHSWYTPSWHE
jgi:hypothetical protein